MIGKQGHSVLVTLVVRKTRFTVVIKAVNKTAQAITDAICDNLKPYQDNFLTLTSPLGTSLCDALLGSGQWQRICLP
ncbi:MAG: IS30 family transposase [Yoonia sp.]